MRRNERLDSRAFERVSGPAWEPIRAAFLEIADTLLGVSNESVSELTTIYVKFCASAAAKAVYAVVWLRNSKEIIVGLSLPDDVSSPLLVSAPPKTTYKGLTRYFRLQAGDAVPHELSSWAQLAFTNAAGSS